MKIALHICCAICAAGAAERLLKEGHLVHGFFYNPNIHPAEEFHTRLDAAQIVAREMDFPLTVMPYLPDEWHQQVVGLEGEPEGGQRCPICFRMRLEQTHQFMRVSGCEAFTTTLTMGSNKSADMMSRIGEEIGGNSFIRYDFKKKEGFKRAGELAQKWGLYRQHYCGCVYSLKEAEARQKRPNIYKNCTRDNA